MMIIKVIGISRFTRQLIINIKMNIDTYKILIVSEIQNRDSEAFAQCIVRIFQEQSEFLLYSLADSFVQGTNHLEKQSEISYIISVGQEEALKKAFNFIGKHNKVNPPIVALTHGPIVLCYSVCDLEHVINNFIKAVKEQKVKYKNILTMNLIDASKKKIIRSFTGQLEFHRGAGSVVKLNIYMRLDEKDFQFLAPLWGDGIVIETPFGSTGRSMALNGPIIHRDLEALLIVPICALSLNFKPIILPQKTQLLIQVDSSSRTPAKMFIDGEEIQDMQRNQKILIQRSNKSVRMVQGLSGRSPSQLWIQSLQDGIKWGQHFGAKKPAEKIPHSRTLLQKGNDD